MHTIPPFVSVPSTETLGRKQRASSGEHIGRQHDFYTFRTLLDITPGEAGATSQLRLNALIQVISTRSQPVIVAVEPVSSETSPADLTDASGVVNVYTLKFAVEHKNAWEGATPTLAESLVGVSGFTTGNISVTYHDSL